MKKKYIKCEGFNAGLLQYLDTKENYLKEGLEIALKMSNLLGKKPSELTEEEKNVLKRSSELVLLATITKELKFN